MVTGGAGDEVIDGGGGTNVAVYSGILSDYHVYRNELGSYTIVDGRPGSPDGTDVLIDIDFLRFANGEEHKPQDVEQAPPAFTITGDDNDNTIVGTAGADRIDGGAGLDTLSGLEGDDVLQGGSSADRLIGGAGNDLLDGGSSEDTAVFSGNLADYSVHRNHDGSHTVTDERPGSPDGRDVLHNVSCPPSSPTEPS